MTSHAPAGSARRAVAAFLLGAVFFAYAFVLRVSPIVMVDDLMAAFAVSGAVLGNLSAFYFYAYSGLQIPVGVLYDRFGVRRLIAVAALLAGAGSLLFSVSETVTGAYLGRVLIGAGCAFSWAGTLSIVNRWFPHRFAFLAGLSQMIAMGGAMLGQAPLAAVVERSGWRDTTMMLAGVGAVLAVALLLVVRDRAGAGERTDTPSPRAGVVLRNPQTWLAAFFGLAMTSPMLAFGALWGVPYLMAACGLQRTEAAGIASLVFLGNGIGGVLIGAWSDRIRRRRLPMSVGAALCVLCTLGYLLLPGLSVPVVAGLVLLSGVGGSSMVLAFASALDHNPRGHAGLTVGIINTAVTGSGALLQPFIGWLLDRAWDGTLAGGARIYTAEAYTSALLVVPVLGALGLLTLLAIREARGPVR
jgi:MFS family permease